MKKLLLIGSNSVHTFNHARLVQDDFDELLLLSDGTRPDYGIPTEVVGLGMMNPFKAAKNISAIRRHIKAFQPDVVHVHQVGASAFLTLRALKKMSKIPVVVTAWGSDILHTPKKNRWYRKLAQTVLRKADYFTSDSLYMAGEMLALAQTDTLDITIANFGINISAGDQEKENLIYSNRLHEPLYRIDRIIDAFAHFSKQHADQQWKLAIAATGSQTEALKAQAKRLNISSEVTFAGWVDKETNSEYYSRARVFVSIPESDATSISLLEAMATGCIPVVSNLPANLEWIVPGLNGLVPVRLDHDIFEGIEDVDSEFLKKINTHLVETKATREVNKELFASLYKRILA